MAAKMVIAGHGHSALTGWPGAKEGIKGAGVNRAAEG